MRLKKLLWLTLGVLTVVALVLSSCGGNQPTTTTSQTTSTTTSTTAKPPTVPTTTPGTTAATTTSTTTAPASSITTTPVYGGSLTVAQDFDTTTFDDCYPWSSVSASWSVNITNDELNDGDWSAGPAGRGETTWLLASGWDGMENLEHGFGLAEWWEMSQDAVTWTFRLRKGAHFDINPASPAAVLVNGREVTADDVVATFNRQWAIPTSQIARTHGVNKPTSITATDKYTVVFKWERFSQLTATVLAVGDLVHIWPKEALEKYNNDLRDWTLSVGTGPFILKDYVKGTGATYVKNPNYWKTYNVPGPGFGMQLPFIDNLKVLVIPDKSTRMAALRTGKIDQSWKWTWEDYEALAKTNPELKDVFYVDAYYAILFNMRDASAPWADIRVRQALHIATNLNGMLKDYYQGHGAVATNGLPMPEYKDEVVPLKDLPQDVQDLFTYDPAKAKQMLKDAGYANGFTASVVCNASQVDVLSIVADNWAKVGVTLNLDVKDMAVYNSMRTAGTAKDMTYATAGLALLRLFQNNRYGSTNNAGGVNDQKIYDAWVDLWDNYLDWDYTSKLIRDMAPYILRQAYQITTPLIEYHTIWQPWIMGYHGEYGTGNSDLNTFAQYVWIDRDMKQKYTGTR